MGDNPLGQNGRDTDNPSGATVVAGKSEAGATSGGAIGDGEASNPSHTVEGGLAQISTTINSHLGLFRSGMATLVVGSALTISVLVYRRGLHGFVSVKQVPPSYFERRKRLRVRIAKVTPLEPRVQHGSPKDNYGRACAGGPGIPSAAPQGSDVLLHAEHITLPRRLLRLQPRSLLPNADGSDVATFPLRLCGVSAKAEGLSLAREELVDLSVRRYCDAELLFQEQRSWSSPSSNLPNDSGSGVLLPVAVCHIHRRRGVLWRDLFQSSLDPKAGFGEHLVSEGLARVREEEGWAIGNNKISSTASAASAPPSTQPTATSTANTRSRQQSTDGEFAALDGDIVQSPPAALERLREDLGRFVSAEEGAQREGRGLWGLQQREPKGGQSASSNATRGGGAAAKGLRDRAVRALRALTRFISR